MKKIKVTIGLLLTGLLLAGCGSGSSTPSVTTTTGSGSTTTTTAGSGYSYTIEPASDVCEVGAETTFSVTQHAPSNSTSEVSAIFSVVGGIGTITDQAAGTFRSEVVGTGWVVATNEVGSATYSVSAEITVNEISSAYTPPLYLDHLPLDFTALETVWFDESSGEAYMNSLFDANVFSDTTHPFLSWFTFRSPIHSEGSMKWYLGSHHSYLPVYAVADGSIVNAALSGSLPGAGTTITIESVEYVKDASIKLIPDSAPTDFYIEYGHIWIKKSIYEDSSVSTVEGVDGSGFAVSAGDVVAYMGRQTEDGYGLDFVVNDSDVKHSKLNSTHKYSTYVNPKLFYEGNNLSAINSFYDLQYQRVTNYQKAPFMCVNGTGEVGHVNRNNNIWGIWYNDVSADNNLQHGDYNMSLLIFIKKDDTNSETYTFTDSNYVGLYSEDATNGVASDDSEYWWEPQLYDNSCMNTPVSYISLATNTTDTGGILKIETPDYSSGSIVLTKYAKFLVSSEVITGFRDDTLKIKYFDSLAEAQAGNLSGDILSNSNYYEYKKSYLP